MSYIKTAKREGMQRNRPVKDYTGVRFSRLAAVALVERRGIETIWRFRCDCAAEIVAPISRVRSGNTSSCGCLARDMVVARNSTHGLSRVHPREYRSWKDMRARCGNPSDTDYAAYGGRGIKVCAAWDDFAEFYRAMGERPPGATLDRINVNGDYEPSNCRWANASEQANNRRSNHVITYRGEARTLAQWCQILDIEPSKVRYRLKQGWPFDKAFSATDYRAVKP